MTLAEIHAVAVEGGFPLAFTHRGFEDCAFFLWEESGEIVFRHEKLPETVVSFPRIVEAKFEPADDWYPLAGFR